MGSEQSSTSSESHTSRLSCTIVVVGRKGIDDCLSELSHLPKGAFVVAVGSSASDIQAQASEDTLQKVTVLFNVCGTKDTLPEILSLLPNVDWIHSIYAGLDKLLYDELINNEKITITNAKGIYSSTLAEYTMAAILHFAKNIPRLQRQQQEKTWEPFFVTEVRGQTLGIVGYGDIGQACAKLAKAFGMKVVALRRRPNLSANGGFLLSFMNE